MPDIPNCCNGPFLTQYTALFRDPQKLGEGVSFGVSPRAEVSRQQRDTNLTNNSDSDGDFYACLVLSCSWYADW